MSFSEDWLALRAPYDTAARASALERRLADWLSDRAGPGPLSVLDLGAGSGNNMAHLAPRLPVPQSWTLVDADGALLEAAARRHPDVTVRQGDLAGDLAALIPEGTGLVTASALIDLVSEAWLARLTARVREIGCALLVVLTYDGRILWESELAGDGEVRDLVNRHQRGEKGFGPALGPEAMRTALVTGWAGAAAEIAPEQAAAIEAWRERASSAPRALAVGHADQLWLPG